MNDEKRITCCIRTALNEREAHAHKDIWAADQTTQGEWRARYGINLSQSWVETELTPIAQLDADRHEADALLIARFKPDNVRKRAAAVLRLVIAMREIVDAHPQDPVFGWCLTCRVDDSSIRHDWPCPTLRALADGLGIDIEEVL